MVRVQVSIHNKSIERSAIIMRMLARTYFGYHNLCHNKMLHSGECHAYRCYISTYVGESLFLLL